MIFLFKKSIIIIGASLILAMFILQIYGCKPEATLVQIVLVYPEDEKEPSVASPPSALKDAAIKTDETQDNVLAIEDESTKNDVRQSPSTKATPPLATATPSPQPTITPLPTRTPMSTPFPTLTPLPTYRPSPSPPSTPHTTVSPTPVSTSTLNPTMDSNSEFAQIILEEERKLYDAAIQRIQNECDLQSNAYLSMLNSLEESMAAHPGSAAEIQMEIDAVKAVVSSLQSDAAAKMEAERERYEAAIAPYIK